MPARIIGLGAWFPETIRRNADWPDTFNLTSRRSTSDRTLVDILGDGTDLGMSLTAKYLASEANDPFLGSCERRVAPPGMAAAEAEALAATAALDDARVNATDVDAILSWSLVPDRVGPSNGCRVAHRLGTARAWAATVDAACASPIAQLELGASLIESGRANVVLLTLSHLATQIFPLDHPGSPNVGDGAAALVLSRSERRGIRATHLVTHGEYYDAVMWCRSRDPAEDAPWWQAGGPFMMGSHDPDGTRKLMRETVAMGAQTVAELASKARLAVADIDALASVQPRAWVPKAIAETLGLKPSLAVDTFGLYAHLGGAGAVVNLIAMKKEGLVKEGGRVVVYAQGAGFTRGAALIEW